MIATNNYVGRTLTIAAGTRVRRIGTTSKRKTDSIVTIRRQEKARGGKTRVFWKSNGLAASALI